MIHEFTHISTIKSFGNMIGDLYNSPDRITRYDIMATGANNEGGPSHFSGYTKMMIGWLTPKEVEYGINETIRLYKTEENRYTSKTKLIKIPRNINNENMYYLLEWRYVEEFESGHNFDVSLRSVDWLLNGSEGLIIYRVDVTTYPNWVGRSPNTVEVIPPEYIPGIDFSKYTISEFPIGAFGKESGVYRFEAEDGITIEIVSIADDDTYADIEITYN